MELPAITRYTHEDSPTGVPPTRSASHWAGPLKPTPVREKTQPAIDFAKGGSDFRCPRTFSCFGKQALSRAIYRNTPAPSFTRQDRWYTPGDKFTGENRNAMSSNLVEELPREHARVEESAETPSYRESARASSRFAAWNNVRLGQKAAS